MDLNFRNHDGIQHFIKKGYMLQDSNKKDYYAPKYVLIRSDYNHFAPVVDSQGYDTGADPSRDYGSRYPQKVGFSTVFTQPYTHDLEDIMESDADYAEGIRIDYYTGTLTFYEIGYFNDGSKGREVPLYQYEWADIDSDWYGAENFDAETFNADVKMNDRAWVAYYEYDFMNVRPENLQDITGDSKMVSFRDYRKELYGIYLTTQEAKKAFNLLKGSLMGHGDWKDGHYKQVINGYKQIYGGTPLRKTIPMEMKFEYVPIKRFGYDTAMHTKSKNAETFEAEKTGKMNLTMKELLVLILVNRDWEGNDWETDDEGRLNASFYHDDVDMKKMRGVLSSLVQKGIITAQEEYVNRNKYTMVFVNDKYTTGVDDYEGSINWNMFDCKDEIVANMGYEEFIEWASTVPESIVRGIAESKRAESNNFNVEFNEWADQEMMSHGKDISFKDWAEDEGMKHGNTEITDWAQHEDESHDARYGAENVRNFEVQMNAERKKRSDLLSEPFWGTSLDSGDWKGILTGFGIGLLGLFGYSKLRK